MPREDWLPFLGICAIFAIAERLTRRFIRGPVSTALMGMFLGAVAMGLVFLFRGVPRDPLFLLLVAAGYGLFVMLIYEGKRLDAEAAATAGTTIQPNSSSSGRDVSAADAEARRSTRR